MTDQETSSGSESNEEMVDAAADASEANARYNLRPRVSTRTAEQSHRGSPLYQAANGGELGTQSAELASHLWKTRTSVAQEPPIANASTANIPDSAVRHGPGNVPRSEEEARRTLHSEVSPFELMTARDGEAHKRPMVPASSGVDGQFTQRDPGTRGTPTRGGGTRKLPTVPTYSRVEQFFARSDPGLRRIREGLPSSAFPGYPFSYPGTRQRYPRVTRVPG